MKIQIIKPGLHTTVQDLGRTGFLSQGVPVSGAMDTLSARIANLAVGNSDDDALIEFTFGNASFMAGTGILIAWAGDGALLKAGAEPLPSERPVFVPEGTVINVEGKEDGCRTYIAVAGGWDLPVVLGSKSTYVTGRFGGLEGRTLRRGDILENTGKLSKTSAGMLSSLSSGDIAYPLWSAGRRHFLPAARNNIRVTPAREFNWFDGASIVRFLSDGFKAGIRSNRMGCIMEGPPLMRRKKGELLSTAVAPGTLQVTGDGTLVLLMYDCQTTGGYPRIAQVAAADLPLCGQLKPGDEIFFSEISEKEAERLYLEQELELSKLASSLRNKFS